MTEYYWENYDVYVTEYSWKMNIQKGPHMHPSNDQRNERTFLLIKNCYSNIKLRVLNHPMAKMIQSQKTWHK